MVKVRMREVNTYIQQKGEVKLIELEEMFPDVSSMTLRRDLQKLEETGQIIRVRGGAVSINSLSDRGERESVYSLRETENINLKVEIAGKAVNFLETGRSIFLDSGTTIMCLAKIIPDEKYIITTSGPNIGLEISKKANPQISLTGGTINKDTLSMSGRSAMSFLEDINIDIAIMATSGFTLENGFTSGNINEYELKKYVVNKSKKVIVLMDEGKIGRNMPYTFARLEDIDVLVTAKKLNEDILKRIKEYDVKLI
ncbi:MAG: DeoR/GlpR family DNA-binding transcription regulator [Clostridia bacterium]|nr:DeoR/GlpR family DNA-binding transcription regulator [Clostridia bacterium]